MPKGPNEARLDSYLVGEKAHDIQAASDLWRKGSKVLDDLAQALTAAKPHVEERFGTGSQTGRAAGHAFATVATYVAAQSTEMQDASTALDSAHAALLHARSVQTKNNGDPLGQRPADATHLSTDHGDAFHNRQLQVGKQQKAYDAQYSDHEQASQEALTRIHTDYTSAIKVMEKIHGNPPTPQGSGGGTAGGSTSGGTGPGSTSVPVAPGGHMTTYQPSHHQQTTYVHSGPQPTTGHLPGHPPQSHPTHYPDPGQTGPGGPGGPGGQGWPTGDHPGVPQGPGSYPDGQYPGTGGLPGTNTSSGITPGTTSGPSSTMVGGLMSGTMIGGASGLSGAFRSSAMTSAPTEEELLASRTSGVARAGGMVEEGGVLGSRGGSATGGAGSRTSGRGSGGGVDGRGGKRKKRAKGSVDFFEDNEGWLEDDEASPGVLH